MTPTDEQVAIVAAAKTGANLMVDAKAGCAKTTTLVMVAKALPLRPSLALAFNVKIKKELKSRFPSHFDVKTLNGLGHGAWSRATGKRLTVEDKKLGKILKAVLDQEKIKDSTTDDFVGILQIVRKAKVMGLIPKTLPEWTDKGLIDDTDESWELIGDSLYQDLSDMQIYLSRRVLAESIQLSFAGVIDYDDQIYMSALFGGIFSKYPVVMVDESQDLSPLNHIQLAKSSLGQLIVVGDPRQAIYAFRGADSASMDTMRQLRPQWTDLPLSTTFRCPKVVVARQQSHAPGFNAAESNAEGEIKTLEKWQEALGSSERLAILCRNNAPLIKTAMSIIRTGKGCTILGREIEKGLVKSLKDICNESDESLVAMQKITDWAEGECSKARANGKEERVAIITDKKECLNAVLSFPDVTTVHRAIKAIETMFSSENLRITLATGHKSKGLEWPYVLHLDPWRIPSKFAKIAQERGNTVPMEQDLNLRYVIETRTQHTLAMASIKDEGDDQ